MGKVVFLQGQEYTMCNVFLFDCPVHFETKLLSESHLLEKVLFVRERLADLTRLSRNEKRQYFMHVLIL